jgi:hypothetical protein
MKNNLTTRMAIPTMLLLITGLMLAGGCQKKAEDPVTPPKGAAVSTDSAGTTQIRPTEVKDATDK